MHRILALLCLALLWLSACARPFLPLGEEGERPPQALQYASNPATYVRGQRIEANVLTIGGGAATRFSVQPALPPGLSLDGTTGTITGTPAIVSSASDYQVTASNGAGATSMTLSLRVAEAPPALAYSRASYVFVLKEPSTTGAPLNGGGPITQCSTTTTLPTGLTLDAKSCAVSGVPLQLVAEQDYPLTLSYFDGAGDASVTATVRLSVAPALSIVPPVAHLAGLGGETLQLTARGGEAPYTFTLLEGDGAVGPSSGLYVSGHSALTRLQVTDAAGRSTEVSVHNQRAWFNGPVYAWASDDEALFAGGQFTRALFTPAPHALLLDPTTLLPRYGFDLQRGFDGPVDVSLVDGDHIIVGGRFNSYRGLPAKRLARVSLATGELDRVFTGASGLHATVEGYVKALALDGTTLYVGSSATSDLPTYRGQVVSILFAIDARTGVLLRDLHAGESVSNSDSVSGLVVMSDGIVVSGNLTVGLTDVRLVRHVLTGSATGATDLSAALPSYNPGPLAVVGRALFVGGDTLSKIDLTTGLADPQFVPAVTGPVAALAVHASGLIVAGQFSVAGQHGLAKLSIADGALTSDAFNTGTGFGPGAEPATLAVDGDRLYVGGDFSEYRGSAVRALVAVDVYSGNRLPIAPHAEAGFASGDVAAEPDVRIATLQATSHGLFAGGLVGAYGGTIVGNIARFQRGDRALDTTFAGHFNGSVHALAAVSDGFVSIDHALFVGGNFDRYGSATTVANIARLDARTGDLSSAFAPSGAGFNGPVHALLYSYPARVTAGGSFTTYRGVGRGGLALLNPNDGSDLIGTCNAITFNGAGVLRTLSVGPGDTLLAGGEFSSITACTGAGACSAATQNVANVARLSASYLPCSDLRVQTAFPSANGRVDAVLSPTEVNVTSAWVGGSFTQLSTESAANFAHWNTLWNIPVTPVTGAIPRFAGGAVRAFTSIIGGNELTHVYAGGAFRSVDGIASSGLARLTGVAAAPSGFMTTPLTLVSDPDRTFDVEGEVRALHTLDGVVYVGGQMSRFGGEPVSHCVAIEPFTGQRVQ